MVEQSPIEKINQRRRQLHVHSIIYYHLNTSIIDDATFDKWSAELVELQAKHPEFKHKGYMYGIFTDWTGDTGMHLTITEDALATAEWLVEQHNKEK